MECEQSEPDPFTVGATHLKDFQVDILDECLRKEHGGLVIPMGSGKTLLSILIALHLAGPGGTILVVVAKSLIPVWKHEIAKFFGDSLKYIVIHSDNKNIHNLSFTGDAPRFIITTSQVLSKIYKQYNIKNRFSYMENINPLTQVRYFREPTAPFLKDTVGPGLFYSIMWDAIIIDEAHMYTNINVDMGQSLASLAARHRWALSGTMFQEPRVERILGYYMLIGERTGIPNSIPDMHKFITSAQYTGLRKTLVFRDKNPAFKMPQVNEQIVDLILDPNESKVYLILRATLQELFKQLQRFKLEHNVENIKKFSAYMMAVLTYLRQGLTSMLIPLTTIAIDIADLECKSELSQILNTNLKMALIDEWLNSADAIYSTRIKKILELFALHKDERIVAFSCFATCLRVVQKLTVGPGNSKFARPLFSITGQMSIKKREQVIADFEKSQNGILFLTYDIGANGLNLQAASTAILFDYWWNSDKTKQAVARILRFGQMAPIVNIYYLRSNTALEYMIFKKHYAKSLIANELMDGKQRTGVPKIEMKEILRFLAENESADMKVYMQRTNIAVK